MLVGIIVLMMIGQSDSNIVTSFKWIIERINVHHEKNISTYIIDKSIVIKIKSFVVRGLLELNHRITL